MSSQQIAHQLARSLRVRSMVLRQHWRGWTSPTDARRPKSLAHAGWLTLMRMPQMIVRYSRPKSHPARQRGVSAPFESVPGCWPVARCVHIVFLWISHLRVLWLARSPAPCSPRTRGASSRNGMRARRHRCQSCRPESPQVTPTKKLIHRQQNQLVCPAERRKEIGIPFANSYRPGRRG